VTARVRAAAAVTAPALFVVIGCAQVLARIEFLRVPAAGRTPLVALLFGSMLAGSLLVPGAKETPHVRPIAVAGLGLAAVVLASAAAGAPVPMVAGTATLPLSLLAAIAEEALFRRAAYGFLEPLGPAAAIGVTALAFAIVHIPLYGAAAFPVDLGAGLLFGWQRFASGTWTVPAATHAAANLLVVLR
jgi:membrane protease YdiL (CAAX protease family)